MRIFGLNALTKVCFCDTLLGRVVVFHCPHNTAKEANMRNLIQIALATLLAACANQQSGPSSLGEPAHTGGTKIAGPGDSAVEFITWHFPQDSTTSNITFTMLVPECDSIGSCRWISDIYGYTQHDVRTAPVRTVVQDAIDICWLTDENDEVVYNTNSLPDGDGNVSFRILKSTGSVTLVCDISRDAEAVTIGTNLQDLTNYKYVGEDFEWYGTYLNLNSWTKPASRVTIR